MKFRKLKASEIECRVHQVKKNGAVLLLYKNARVDMAILDETVGPERWQREHKEVKGNVYCGVSIYLDLGLNYGFLDTALNEEERKLMIDVMLKDRDSQWVTKWDAGAESYTEKEKGESSDSFKRACFNWGIGRELYTSPFIWIKPKDENEIVEKNNKVNFKWGTKFNVADIDYRNDAISYLIINDQDGTPRFKFGDKRVNETTLNQLNELGIKDSDMKKWLDYYQVDTKEQFQQSEAEFIIERFQRGNK